MDLLFAKPTNERDFSIPSEPRCGNRQRSATMGSANFHQLTWTGKSMATVHVGIDLAKIVFALHGVSETGAAQLREPKVARGKFNEVLAALPPAPSGSRRAPARTTGPGCLPSTAKR